MANSHSSQTSFNSLRIFFWNVRSIGTKFSEVKKISTEYDIIACVESWLTPDSEYCIPGFHVVRKDRVHTRGGGIAIWVRKNIAFKEIDDTHLHESIEICALQLNNVKPNLNLYVCYRPPGSTLSQADWNQVITETCKHNALLIGDFNALNLQWNCPRTEENGDRLQTAYKLHNVFLHNCDSTTYTNLRSNYTSNLDLVFSTQDIKDKISTEICEETWSSDHHPIFITISVTKSLYHKKKLKLSSKRTKWENFCQRMDENYQYFFSEEFESLSADNKHIRNDPPTNDILPICIYSLLGTDNQIMSKEKLNIYHYSYEITFTSLPVNLNLGRKMQQSSTPNARLDHYINSGQFTAIYTDASKSKDSPSVGYAYYCEDTQFEDKTSVSNLTSVYTAECAAINAALDYILQFNQKRFLVISDSHSALTSLNTVNLNIKTNPYIYEIKRKFLIYVQQHPNNALEFLWVPGHEGLSGNEYVDKCAKSAASAPPSLETPVVFTDMYERFKRDSFMNSENKNFTDSLEKGTRYFQSFYKNEKHPWFHNKPINRATIVSINRMRADHHSLAASLFRKNIVSDPRCQCGHEAETLDHVIWNCDLYADKRKQLFQKLLELKVYPPYNTEQFLAFPNSAPTIAICQFISISKLQI
uniref:ribonuclease H n=1 Tax=Trichogramma kaykai TaxID=54128 RepID=A0ABD2VZL9_9HYME